MTLIVSLNKQGRPNIQHMLNIYIFINRNLQNYANTRTLLYVSHSYIKRIFIMK